MMKIAMTGMLAAVLLCSAAVDQGQADAITSFLAKLPLGDPKSLCLAQEYVQSRLADAKPRDRSAAFFALWDFYDRAVQSNQTRIEQMGGSPSPEDTELLHATLRIADPNRRNAQLREKCPKAWVEMEPWLRCGYVIAVEFGETLFLDPDPRILRTLQPLWDADCQEYLDLFLKESPYSLDYDGALAIPWDRLRSRIGKWERFRAAHRENPDLVRHIDRQIKTMFQYYLCGAPNSELFGATGELNADVRESYELFLKLNSGSREYRTMQSAARILQQNNWKMTPALIRLYRSRGYSTDVLEEEMRRSGK